MKKRLSALLIIAGGAIATVAAHTGIYHKGWIDFNKNGRMDDYENPALPVERRVADPRFRVKLCHNEFLCPFLLE